MLIHGARTRAARFALALAAVLASIALSCSAIAADPPGRVGRVALVEGEVLLFPAAGQRGIASPLNYPLATGAVLRSGRNGRAEIEFGVMTLWLDRNTELTLTQVDEDALRVDLLRGRLAARASDPGDDTPPQIVADGVVFELGRAGHFRFDTDDIATTVTAVDGQALIIAGSDLYSIRGGQVVRAAGGRANLMPGAGPERGRLDAFDRWVRERESDIDPRRAPEAVAPRYVSPEMPGWQDLDRYGTWEQSEDFGTQWVPNWVPAGWAPYRSGEWVHLNPWGWTWIDHAPWGFAPFHFGRWRLDRGRWCWIPGERVRRPVFAPALVTIIVGTGRNRPRSWAPLAPWERFVPAFRASPDFVSRLNASHTRWHRPGETSPWRGSRNTEAITVRGGELPVGHWRDRHNPRPATTVDSRATIGPSITTPTTPTPAARRDTRPFGAPPLPTASDPATARPRDSRLTPAAPERHVEPRPFGAPPLPTATDPATARPRDSRPTPAAPERHVEPRPFGAPPLPTATDPATARQRDTRPTPAAPERRVEPRPFGAPPAPTAADPATVRQRDSRQSPATPERRVEPRPFGAPPAPTATESETLRQRDSRPSPATPERHVEPRPFGAPPAPTTDPATTRQRDSQRVPAADDSAQARHERSSNGDGQTRGSSGQTPYGRFITVPPDGG